MDEPNMPRVIPGIWIGLLASGLGVAAAFGLDLSPAQQTAIIGFASALGAVFSTVDGRLRRARLEYFASKENK
jgi:hypothetical protein